MKKNIIGLSLILLLFLSSCNSLNYTETLKYQEEGPNSCEAYYITIKDENIMINTTNHNNLESHIGEKIIILGNIKEKRDTKKCQFKKTIIAKDIEFIPCQEKEGMCCQEEVCQTTTVTCIQESHPVFQGCDNNCSPKWSCEAN